MIALLVAAALGAGAGPAPFEVLSEAFDLRTLTVAYETGPCWTGEPELGLEETDRAIRIIVVQERVEGCSAPPSYGRVNLRLRRPVGGRRIQGVPRIAAPVDALSRHTIPRVLDFAASDAERTLALQGFRTRRIGRPAGTVAFQSPLPGRRARTEVVRLTVGRGLFRARALASCLERAGVAAVRRTPKPGDADAPDLVLWLQEPGAFGEVGLYADPVRATELTPAFRRNLRRAGGVLERRRHVAIGWFAKPRPALREGAKACVFGPLGRPRR